MRTQLEQAAILSKYQCCFAELGSRISAKLGKHKMCDLVKDLRDMKLTRAYLYRIHKYYTLPYNITSGTLVDIVRNNTSNVTITITVDSTDYTYTGTGDLATVISSLKTTLINAGYLIHTIDADSFVFYTYDPAYDNITVSCTNSIDDDDNSTTCTGYTNASADTILDDYNCLSRTEICGILNHMACILDKYCTNC